MAGIAMDAGPSLAFRALTGFAPDTAAGQPHGPGTEARHFLARDAYRAGLLSRRLLASHINSPCVAVLSTAVPRGQGRWSGPAFREDHRTRAS